MAAEVERLLMGIVNRIRGLMSNPDREWESVATEAPGQLSLMRDYILPLSLLAPAATFIGMWFFDTSWDADHGYALPRERIAGIVAATYAFEIASVYLLAIVFYLLARTEGCRPSFVAAFQVAALGSVPLLISGVLLVIPFNIILTMFAMIYSFYLYHLGAVRLMGIRPVNSAEFVGVSLTCLLVLSGFMGAAGAMVGVF